MTDIQDESCDEFAIPPCAGAYIRFKTSGDGCAFRAILLHIPDDVAPHFSIDEISVGELRKIVSPSAGDLLELDGSVAEDVVVSAWNLTDEARNFRAVLWIQYEGWGGPGGLQEFAAWLGRCEIGRHGAGPSASIPGRAPE